MSHERRSCVVLRTTYAESGGARPDLYHCESELTSFRSPRLVAISGINRYQFQALQEWAGIQNELYMPASRARQNRIA